MILTFCLILLSLIFIYNKKYQLSGIFVLIGILSYVLYSFKHIVPIGIMITNGAINPVVYIWFIVEVFLMILSCIFAFKRNRKIALWFIWITISILILQHWNHIFTLFLILKNKLF